ncbi:hypothetical protein [Paenibacillus macerans]|uniref:hypothetical protein n=1 Tax=Paenibacillus macerans TaxID=44252 RepID=UPI0022E6998E|nr:hypothetical protein [Paenibacillus macerans]
MVILFAVIIGFALFYYTQKKKKKKVTVQDLIGAKTSKVSWDGLAQNENVYRLVVEVEPINLDNASLEERKVVWINFLSLINTLSIPYTLIKQSQLFEMKDYADSYGHSIEHLPSDYPALKESGEDVCNYLKQSLDQGAVRDDHGYILFEYDPVVAAANAGVQAGIGGLDRLLGKAVPRKNKITEEEQADLALQILEEAANTLYSFCEQVGMRYQRLDRGGVWNYTYQTLQRELAPQARMIDAIQSDSFKRVKQSLTAQEIDYA